MSTHQHVDSPAGIGARLLERRKAAGLSQRELAFPGCTAVYICRVEKGDRVPSLQVIRELADRLGVSMDWLATGRNVTEVANGRRVILETGDWDSISGRDDPQQRFRVYSLCECQTCFGVGKLYSIEWKRCAECRGEGRTLALVATAGTPEGVGTALVALGREGELDDCPVGVLDVGDDAEEGKRWIVSPWLPSPRNVSDAGRVLRASQTKGEK